MKDSRNEATKKNKNKEQEANTNGGITINVLAELLYMVTQVV